MSSPSTPGVVEPPIEGPSDLSRDDYVAVLKRTLAEVKSDDVPNLAAGVAFKIFLSLFPALIAAAAIYGLVRSPAEVADLVGQLDGLLPEAALGLVQEGLQGLTETEAGAARGIAVTAVLGGLISATGAAASLIAAMNRAYGISDKRRPVALRLTSLWITLGLLAALVVLAAVVVFGPQVRRALLPDGLQSSGPVLFLFGVGQFVLAVVVLVLLFAFVYWVGPNRERPEWEWMSPGAVIGVVGWLLVAGGFTAYVQNFGNYEVYGAIAGVVVLLLWLQLSMLAILVGAEFNAEMETLQTERRLARERALHGGPFSGVPPPGAVGAADAPTSP